MGNSRVLYSTDYGRTVSLWVRGDPSEIASSAEDVTFVITDKELVYYQKEKDEYFFAKKVFDGKNVDEKSVTSSGNVKNIPAYLAPMGRYQCNADIKPRGVSEIKIKEYDERRRPYFEQLLSATNKTISVLVNLASWQVTLRTHYAAYDVVPQVIYRLDDNRYVELNNYENCQPTYEDEKVVKIWYHDLNRNIKTQLPSKVRNYQGKIINADSSGKNLAFPVMSDRMTCMDEVCGESMVYYSTDYGKTFKSFYYLRYSDGTRDNRDEPRDSLKYSKNYLTTVITDKELVVYKQWGKSYKTTKIRLDKEDEDKIYGTEDPIIPPHTSFMENYQCDTNIKPKSIGNISVDEYNRQEKGN